MIRQQVLPRASHANSDRSLREGKARRIEGVLRSHAGDIAALDMLDVGTGAGYIASYFGVRTRSLVSVDIVDERACHDFDFVKISSEELPLGDESVDIVLSNHVIEHVDDQLVHLREIRRVLRPKGIGYLATPNRFALIEPHFRLPLLSWLPGSLRDKYVRVTGKGPRYDVTPVTYESLRRLADQAGLSVHDQSLSMARDALRSRLGLTPPVLGPMRALLPSFVVLLKLGCGT